MSEDACSSALTDLFGPGSKQIGRNLVPIDRRLLVAVSLFLSLSLKNEENSERTTHELTRSREDEARRNIVTRFRFPPTIPSASANEPGYRYARPVSVRQLTCVCERVVSVVGWCETNPRHGSRQIRAVEEASLLSNALATLYLGSPRGACHGWWR